MNRLEVVFFFLYTSIFKNKKVHFGVVGVLIFSMHEYDRILMTACTLPFANTVWFAYGNNCSRFGEKRS